MPFLRPAKAMRFNRLVRTCLTNLRPAFTKIEEAWAEPDAATVLANKLAKNIAIDNMVDDHVDLVHDYLSGATVVMLKTKIKEGFSKEIDYVAEQKAA